MPTSRTRPVARAGILRPVAGHGLVAHSGSDQPWHHPLRVEAHGSLPPADGSHHQLQEILLVPHALDIPGIHRVAQPGGQGLVARAAVLHQSGEYPAHEIVRVDTVGITLAGFLQVDLQLPVEKILPVIEGLRIGGCPPDQLLLHVVARPAGRGAGCDRPVRAACRGRRVSQMLPPASLRKWS